MRTFPYGLTTLLSTGPWNMCVLIKYAELFLVLNNIMLLWLYSVGDIRVHLVDDIHANLDIDGFHANLEIDG
jgi:hypothetical protein